jgi:hypothetical protein
VTAGQIAGVGGTDGSQFSTSPLFAAANAPLQFYFDYVTSDGAMYADYAFAQLQTAAGGEPAFTTRIPLEPGALPIATFGVPVPPKSGLPVP